MLNFPEVCTVIGACTSCACFTRKHHVSAYYNTHSSYNWSTYYRTQENAYFIRFFFTLRCIIRHDKSYHCLEAENGFKDWAVRDTYILLNDQARHWNQVSRNDLITGEFWVLAFSSCHPCCHDLLKIASELFQRIRQTVGVNVCFKAIAMG